MSKFTDGMGVWVSHPKYFFVSAEIINYQDGDTDVQVRMDMEDWDEEDQDESKREIKLPISKIFNKNPDILEGVDDLSTLSHLHEAAILHNLHYRYNLNQIYTYIGKILISINPYTSLPIYGKEMITAYYGKQLGTLSPHVYAIAEDAFKDMRYDGTSQSILVSGESGAGKTQATKYLLQYFAAMGNLIKESSGNSSNNNNNNNNSNSTVVQSPNLSTSSNSIKKPSTSNPTPQLDTKSIEERVLESTPLLEAFGNAKTLRNDNSSRFGKFIEIHFNEYGSIIGAKILTYLLEKSRIVKQVANERNYHIFYQVLRGLDTDIKEKLYLGEVEDYYYLNQSECLDVDDVSDEETFKETIRAMQVSSINKEEQENIFKVISIVLLLGNIKFDNNTSTTEDSSYILNKEDSLVKVCELLGCSEEELEKTFLTRKVISGKETFFIGNSKERAENSRDSLAMYLYGMLFDWLVMKINSAMSIETPVTVGGRPQKSKSFIGVLDIYGFESFDVNGLNQFCINFANEKLQQLFNQHVFKEEQQEYIKEKIDWSYIDFNDNQDTLDLIEKKPICILTLLDEETTFPKATSQSLATKLSSKLTSHSKFEKPRFSNTAFTINHYAGKVTYDTDQFLEKNRDFIIQEQILLLHKSTFSFIKTILSVPLMGISNKGSGSSNTGGSASTSMKFQSVVSQFSNSLASLMKTISQTTPHYIRCIKPNNEKLPQVFNKSQIIGQLRCGGIMESVRICTAGFPTRRLLTEFYHRYKLLLNQGKKSNNNLKIKDLVENLLKSIDSLTDDKYKIGLTKVFLRAGQLAHLEDMRLNTLNHSAIIIQSIWRRYYFEKKYKAIRNAALTIQTKIRGQQAKSKLDGLRRVYSAIRIQTCWRRYKEQKKFNSVRNSAIQLQTLIRRSNERELVIKERLERACTTLQCAIRSSLAKKEVAKKLNRIIRIQSLWRSKKARKIYLDLRAEARSLKSVQEARNKLEEKLQELQWRLGVEQKLKQQSEEDKHKIELKLTESIDKVDRLELSLSQSSSKYQNLKANHQTQTQDLEVNKLEVQKLTEQIQSERKSNSSLEKESQDLKSKLQLITNEVQLKDQNELNQSKRILELENELIALKETIKEKDRNLDSLEREREEEREEFNQNMNNIINQLSDYKDYNQQLEDSKNELEIELQQLKSDLETLNSHNSLKESENNESLSKLNLINQDTTNQFIQSKEKIIQLELDLSEQMNKYTTDLTQSKFENQQILQKLTDQTTISEEIQLKLTKSNESYQELSEKFKKLKSKYQTLENENKQVQLDLEKIKIQKSILDDENKQIQNRLDNTKIESIQSQTSSSKYKDKIKELKLTIENLNRDFNQKSSDLKTKEEKYNQISLELGELKKETIKQSKEFGDLTSQLNIEKSKLDIDIKNNELEIKQLKQQNEQQESQLKSSSRMNNDQKEIITKLESEIKQLNNIKERFENEFFTMKESSSNNAQESSYLKEITSQMKQNQQRLEKDFDDKKQLTDKLTDERDQQNKLIETIKIQNDRFSISNQQKDQQIQDNLNQIISIEKEMKQHKQTIDQLELEIGSLNKLNNEHLVDIQKLQTEKESLKTKYQSLKSKNFVKLETELIMIKQHSDYLESIINDFRLRNSELSDTNQQLKQQSQLLKQETEKLVGENNQQIHDKISILQLEKEKLEELFENSKKEFKGKEAELLALVKENELLHKENKEIEDNSLQITNHLMQVKLEFEKKLSDQENKQKRQSVNLQQNLQDTISTQLSEMDSMKLKIDTLSQELLEKNRELQSLQNQFSQSLTTQKELMHQNSQFKELEEIIDFKESEWERLARVAGNQEDQTKLISDYLLSCKLETTTLAALMWTNQIQYWRSFEKKNVLIFKGIIRSTIDFMKSHFEDMDLLSYLLSCSSLLLFVFTSGDKPKVKVNHNSILPQIPTLSELDDLCENMDIRSPEEFIKYLEITISRTYGLLFKIITAKLTPLIEGSILNDNYNKVNNNNNNNNPSGAVNKLLNPLISIEHVGSYLLSIISTFQHRMIHFTLSQKLFNQIFCFIGNYIKQSFLLRQTFCTDDFALFVKQRIDGLAKWANEIGDVWVGDISQAFIQVREIIAVITLRDKEKLVEEKTRKQLCPTLNINQLKFILSMYHKGDFGSRLNIKLINSICPPDKNASVNHNNKQLIDENKLALIPISTLHYLEIGDISNLSIPLSIKYSIESEIKNIALSLITI